MKILFILLALMLIGCGKQEDINAENKESNIVNNQENLKEKYSQKESKEQPQKIRSEYNNSDLNIINQFTKFEEKLDKELNGSKSEEVKNKAKGTFILIVDFIFYDGKINGVLFDDLTNSGQEKVLSIANSINNKIEKKFPKYKDTINKSTKQAFNNASELIKIGANNIDDFSKNNLNNENYNAIIEARDNLVNYTNDAVSIIGDCGQLFWKQTKSSVKTWYELMKKAD